MRPVGSQWTQHLTQLSRVLGHQAANLELKWMFQTINRRPKADGHAADALASMVARRVSGEPLQYILGTQPFGSLELLTRPPVLIPRPETEDWTIRLSEYIKPTRSMPLRLLDLCTGSGCIPLLLCKLWPPGTVRSWGVDISAEAIRLAEDNATHCGIPLQTSKASNEHPSTVSDAHNTFRPLQADMRKRGFVHKLRSSGISPPFDVITSNPPYIPKHEYENLPMSVRGYEDVRALLGDPHIPLGPATNPPQPRSESGRGLTFYHDIAMLVAEEHDSLLADDGVIAVEVGKGQARDVETIFREEGNLKRTTIWSDPWEVERVVVASRK
ncbi:S-adenosyl-L-methionine-dependent methyltransferase [Trametopsis cervina]|nr:S-adenosyl-L-methionine-dependent methyltransferase [Trametopsis cervina]